MFQTKLILRLHHLYVIRYLLEIQRRCNLWYSRMKHKFVFLLNNHLQLNGFKSLKTRISDRHNGNDSYYGDPSLSNVTADNWANNGRSGRFFEDLNNIIMNPGLNAVSIPMQMLLLPFIVHPHVPQSDPITTASCHLNINKDKNDSRQQWMNEAYKNNNSVYSKSHSSITLVPSHLAGAQSHLTPVVTECQSFVSRSSQQREISSRQHNVGSTWSAVPLDCGSKIGMTMRNPLIHFATAIRREKLS